jgi:hypothetical protein
VGRTNPTYRDRLTALEDEYGAYRRGLRASEQTHFDQLFEHGRTYAHAAGYLNHPEPEIAFLLSVLLAHERQIVRLTDSLEGDDGVQD